jgi:hypothetical protein
MPSLPERSFDPLDHVLRLRMSSLDSVFWAEDDGYAGA